MNKHLVKTGDFIQKNVAKHGSVLVLIILTLILTTRGITDGDFRHPDASVHAMDGVFMRDFVADMPGSLHHPLDYALEYYAHYPALGIVLYYPPFFAIVEAVFFAIFGIGVFTARLAVVAFAVLGVAMMYKLVRLMATNTVAFLSAALFVSLPTVVFWSRQVMLEMPATAMILSAAHFFFKYVELHQRRSAIWATLFTIAAVMTKQTALFIVPAFALYLFICRRWDILKRWELWTSAAIIAAVLISYFIVSRRYVHFFYVHFFSGVRDPSLLVDIIQSIVLSWSKVFSLPLLIVILCVAVSCMFWEWIRPSSSGFWLVTVLAAMFFLESVYIEAVDRRYAFFGIPFFIYFIPTFLDRMNLLNRRAVRAGCLLGILIMAGFSYFQGIPAKRGHYQATREMIIRNGSKPFLLFDGYSDTQIVFFVRQMDPTRRLYLLRGSKMLYTCATFKQYGYQERITTRAALMDFIREYGIGTIAVEDKDLVGTHPGRLLRDTLKDSNLFECAGSFSLTAPGTQLNDVRILVYVLKSPSTPNAKFLAIPLAGLQRVIKLPLDGKGRPTIEYSPWNNQKYNSL